MQGDKSLVRATKGIDKGLEPFETVEKKGYGTGLMELNFRESTSKKRKIYSAVFNAPIITAQGALAAQQQNKTISQFAAPPKKITQ